MIEEQGKRYALVLFAISIVIIALFLSYVESVETNVRGAFLRGSSANAVSSGKAVDAIVLGIVQGVTEWLPISSSGHLVILQRLSGIYGSVAFDVMLHLGTLLSVIYFLRKDLVDIIRAVLGFEFSSRNGKLAFYTILGTLPVAVLGMLWKPFFESLFTNLTIVGITLIINGVILYFTRYSKPHTEINLTASLFIGAAQAVSIIPGISRSGATISMALFRGIEKESAYKFSFLLSIVAILGASLVELGEIAFWPETLEAVILGVVTSSIVGYIALKIVSRYVLTDGFYKFAYYCWVAGFSTVILSLL